MWIPKGAALVRGRRLFEAQHLLEEVNFKPLPNLKADWFQNCFE